jgi:hypothetical protein
MNDERQRRPSAHLGIAWRYRNTRRTCSPRVRVHAVTRPDGVMAHRDQMTGEVYWSGPWKRVCDDGDACERRLGWVDDVTCPGCLRKLAGGNR